MNQQLDNLGPAAPAPTAPTAPTAPPDPAPEPAQPSAQSLPKTLARFGEGRLILTGHDGEAPSVAAADSARTHAWGTRAPADIAPTQAKLDGEPL